MIFNLDNTVITKDEGVCYVLAHALQRANERMHFVTMDYPVLHWIETALLADSKYLGDFDRDAIMKDHCFMHPSALEGRTLRTVLVGQGDGLVSVQEMLNLVEEPGVVVLENGLNDWSVLKSWADLMCMGRNENKSINGSVQNAIQYGLLRNVNSGGGSGSIRNSIVSIMPHYNGLHALRVTTVFDSDKCSSSDSIDHNASLKEFLNGENIEWHELSRREMENYFPIEVYERAGFVAEGVDIFIQDRGNWAYVDVEKLASITYKKRELPVLSQTLTEQDLVTLGDEAKNEIQSVILHLAKYI